MNTGSVQTKTRMSATAGCNSPADQTIVITANNGQAVIVDSDIAQRIQGAQVKISGGYAYFPIYGGGKYWLHRFIMQAPKGLEVDHINRDKLDNRRVNLRLCTHAENHRNRGPRKNTSSGLKGVSRFRNGWAAEITVDRRVVKLGSNFKTKEEAYAVYCSAARELHGEFACVA